MSIILWVLMGFVVYSLIVLILTRLALKKEDGKLKIKKDSFFIYYFYRDNVVVEEKWGDNKKQIPKNQCQLYLGGWWGILWGIFALFLWGLAYYLFIFLIFSIGTIIAFFLGYLPTPKRFIANKEEPFEKMKWDIAPWKIILPVGFAIGVAIFHKEISGVMVKIPEILVQRISSQPKGVNITLGVILTIVFVYLTLSITRVWETKLYKKAKEAFASLVKKHCKEIEIKD